MGEFAVSIEHSEAKSASASASLTPRQGALPLDPADPRHRLALRALAMAPPFAKS